MGELERRGRHDDSSGTIGHRRATQGARYRARRCTRLVLLCLSPALLGGCTIARDILYAPLAHSTVPPVWAHGDPTRIAVTAPGNRHVAGYYWPGAPGDPDIFVFFHGRHMNALTGAKFAQYLLGRGDAVLVASYRGFGDNPGLPSEKAMMQDSRAFIAQARRLAGPQARIWLVGHSIGGGVALQAANENEKESAVKGAFIISGFTRVSAAVPRLLRAFVPDKWDNLAAARAARLPLLFFSGGMDRYIPAGSGEALLAAAGGPSLLLVNAQMPHNPDMAVLGPWISAVANDLGAGAALDALPTPPPGWAIAARRP